MTMEKESKEIKVSKAKKITKKKAAKQQTLEDILFECRNQLRGNANTTQKRHMLLTLAFHSLLCSRIHQNKQETKA